MKNSINIFSDEKAEILSQIADIYFDIYTELTQFYRKVQCSDSACIEYNSIKSKGISTSDLRHEEVKLLLAIVEKEHSIDKLINRII